MAVNIITKFVLGQFAKRSARKSEGIATLLKASDPVVQSNVRTIEIILKNMGIDPKSLKSTDDVLKYMNYHKAMMNQSLKQGFKGLDLDKGIKSLEKKPTIESLLKGEKYTDERGRVWDFGTKDRPFPGFTPRVQQDVNSIIKDLKNMEPVAAMKEANLIIGRKGRYKNLSNDEAQRILKDTDDHIFQRDIQYDEFGDPIKPDPEDMASGGRVPLAGGKGVMSVIKMLLKKKPKPKREIDVAALKKKHGLDPESLKKDEEAFNLRLQQILAKHSTKHADGGRIGMMYGGDPGFAFEYGGSWADWHDQHRDQMPVEQYIKTKLPKHRLPFREMNEGGIARAGFPFGGQALKAIRAAWRANKTWGVGGPPYKPEATSFNIKEMTKRNLGKELSLTDLRRLSESPLAPRGGKGHFEDFNRQFKNIKASILKEKLRESKIHAEAMIDSAEDTIKNANQEFNKAFGPLRDKKKQQDMAKKISDQFTREGKKQLAEAKEGLKEIDIYIGMLQKKGRSVHQSGGLAYMLGEPTYSIGGSVGHAPWHKPTGQQQPLAPMDTPTPHVAGTPDPLKAPRGIPSLAPKNMDPAYMQQQMMQQAMMGRGQGNMAQGPRPMANAGGRIGFDKGGYWSKLKKKYKGSTLQAMLDNPQLMAAELGHEGVFSLLQMLGMKEGGRARFDKGKKVDLSKRRFLKGTGAAVGLLSMLPFVGKFFKAAKVAKPAAAVTETIVKSNAAGMPAWFPSLVKRVIDEGDDVSKAAGAMERQTVHKIKLPESNTPVEVMHDLTSGDVIVDIGIGKHGWSSGFHGQPTRLVLKKGEWIEPTKGKKGIKTKDEFSVEEAEFTGGHPENVKFEDVTVEKYGQHGSDFTEVEKYATGKTSKGSKAQKEVWEADWDDSLPDDMEYASGGLAYLLGE